MVVELLLYLNKEENNSSYDKFDISILICSYR